MEQVKYFSVQVKLQEETDMVDRAGNPKMKKWKEDYLVHAGTSEDANQIVKEFMEGTMAEWRIVSVKEAPYCDVLG